MRQRSQGEKPNFHDTAKFKGKEFVKKLIQQQENRYHKKFAFERGHYHQCIPNPKNDGTMDEMITVQLVTRVLEGDGSSRLKDLI